MRDFIEYILKQIVTNPDAIVVTEEMEGDAYVYHITAAQEDMGIIIGREGRNINSIRNVAKAKAIKDNVFVKVILEETDKPREEAAPEVEAEPEEEAEIDADAELTDEPEVE